MTELQQTNLTRLLLSGQGQHLAFRLLIGSGMDEQDAWQHVLEIAVQDFMRARFAQAFLEFDSRELCLRDMRKANLPTVREWECYAGKYWPVLESIKLMELVRMRYGGALQFSFMEDVCYPLFGPPDTESKPAAWYHVLYRRLKQ